MMYNPIFGKEENRVKSYVYRSSMLFSAFSARDLSASIGSRRSEDRLEYNSRTNILLRSCSSLESPFANGARIGCVARVPTRPSPRRIARRFGYPSIADFLSATRPVGPLSLRRSSGRMNLGASGSKTRRYSPRENPKRSTDAVLGIPEARRSMIHENAPEVSRFAAASSSPPSALRGVGQVGPDGKGSGLTDE
uniref:Uncharacterized protein n=1 Tax=Steinernema glaseri TaxID=37863 RepID=A0A1I7XXM8_9BILA